MLRQSIRELSRVDPALQPFLARPIDEDILWGAEYLKAPVVGEYYCIGRVLTEEALTLLNELPITDNGKCPNALVEQHPVAGPLARTMGRISLTNRYNDLMPPKIITSLRHESGIDKVLASHRDVLDGHATIFNWDCSGDLTYVINGQEVALDENEIIVINGAADLIYTQGVVQTAATHTWATKPHSVVGRGFSSRKRLLVYADGLETDVCQIPA